MPDGPSAGRFAVSTASVADRLAAHDIRGHLPRPLVSWMAGALLLATLATLITASSPNDPPLAAAIARGIIVGVPLAAGLYAWRSGYAPRFGFLLAVTGALLFVTTFAESGDSELYTLGRAAGWLVELMLVYLILAFPTGELADRADRLLFSAMAAVVGVFFVPQLLVAESVVVPSPYTTCTEDCPESALFIGSEPGFVDAFLQPAASALVVAVMVTVLYRLARRMRLATPLARRAYKPVLAVGAARLALVGVAFVGRDIDPSAPAVEAAAWLLALAIPAIAIAFLVALVGSRLFAGDALRRLAQAMSTAHDARGLQRNLSSALGDPSLEVAFPVSPAQGGWMDCGGHAMTLPKLGSGRSVSDVKHEGTVVAALVHDDALDTNPRLLDAATAMAGVVLDNHRLVLERDAAKRAQREASARVAARAERERRRIEQNLHDGAQQRLVALGIELELAENVVRRDTEEGVELLRRLRSQVGDALEEVRDLAHGVSPPLLADRGLKEAIQAVAARSPVRVDIAADGLPRYPPEVESTVYFCVLEGIQNALKHAKGVQCIHVQIEDRGSEVHFCVRDDGAGAQGGQVVPGAGVTNMRDRAVALGGDVRVTSARAVGTTVRGYVPSSTSGLA